MKLKAIKFIWSNIPKWVKWTLGFIFTTIIGYIILQMFTGEKILISTPFAIKLLAGVLILIVVGFIWAAIVGVSKLLEGFPKKVLSLSEVALGICKTGDFGVDIFGKIDLSMEDKPDISVFIKQISISDPYCFICGRPLCLYSVWHNDDAVPEYKCDNCGRRVLKKQHVDYLNDTIAEVRNNYDKYWEKYKEEIFKLTEGKPEDYEVPYAPGIYTSKINE